MAQFYISPLYSGRLFGAEQCIMPTELNILPLLLVLRLPPLLLLLLLLLLVLVLLPQLLLLLILLLLLLLLYLFLLILILLLARHKSTFTVCLFNAKFPVALPRFHVYFISRRQH